MKHRLLVILLAVFALDFQQAEPALAAAEIDEEEMLTLQAAASFMQRDFNKAESLYTRIISINPESAEAYVQRGLARRELSNIGGMQSDARQAVSIIDAQLRVQPHSANLYYQRSVAMRLLKDFDAAERDVRQAYRLGKNGLLENDLNAIAVERKMNSQ